MGERDIKAYGSTQQVTLVIYCMFTSQNGPHDHCQTLQAMAHKALVRAQQSSAEHFKHPRLCRVEYEGLSCPVSCKNPSLLTRDLDRVQDAAPPEIRGKCAP